MAGPAMRRGGFHPHPPSFTHRFFSKAMGATMFFWIMYRAREDGAVWLGWRHPWDGHGHGHDEEHH